MGHVRCAPSTDQGFTLRTGTKREGSRDEIAAPPCRQPHGVVVRCTGDITGAMEQPHQGGTHATPSRNRLVAHDSP